MGYLSAGSRRFLLAAIVVFWIALPLLAQQDADGRVRGYVPPPATLELVGDHWTPYQPPIPPEGAEVHIVVRGDTLWDLANHYYEDPYLWPVIWDANRYITYSHWIYPGDPLVVPPRPTVVGEDVAEPPTEVNEFVPTPVREPEPEPEPVAKAPPAPTGPVLIPAAEQQEMICTAQLVEHFDPSPLSILGTEEPEKEMQAQTDIVYFSAGRDMGIEPGAEYVVVHSEGALLTPEKPRNYTAVYLQRLGRVRVLAVHPNSATAEIIDACAPIRAGDYLVPYREMPVPMVERIPLKELSTPFPGRLNGFVVVSTHPKATIAGSGDVVGIDLGSRAGLTAGDRVLFWRNGPGPRTFEGTAVAPRRIVAQGVVLVTNGGGSMVKILESRSEVRLGDRAEIL